MTDTGDSRKALVVVLGELARSPRMQYHCNSLASNNYQVSVIATRGGPCEEIESNPNIKLSLTDEAPDFRKYLPSTLAYLIKPIWQSFDLIYHLFILSLVDVIIMQNPPSIPTLPILYFYSKLTGSRLIIDWHNYGYSILGLSLSPHHPIVRISRWIEMFFGRLASAGFCVSEAMRKDLVETHGIHYPLYVLYDKPPKHFQPLSSTEKQDFLTKLAEEFDVFNFPDERPALVISSTSWTEDEDFGLLLEALKKYDDSKVDDLPSLVCVITGRGPLKAFYEQKIRDANLKHVKVILPWLSSRDYPKMVASCDIGISLHSSSSKVDLPMKVVDMFGCGIPVLAYYYNAIHELVIEDFYGLTFTNSDELYSKMVLLLRNQNVVDEYRKNLRRRFLTSRWEDNWNKKARPVIDRL